MPTQKGPKPIYLAPSDMTGLLQECPRCYVLKVRHGVTPPKEDFPPVVNEIRQDIKEGILNGRLPDGIPGSPDLYAGQVKSECLGEIGDREVRVRGYVDMIYTPEKGNQSADLGLVAIKLGGKMTEDKLTDYEYQLNTLALAVGETLQKVITHNTVLFVKVPRENPADGTYDFLSIDINPETTAAEPDLMADKIRDEIIPMLAAAGLPAPGEKCKRCEYFEKRLDTFKLQPLTQESIMSAWGESFRKAKA